MIFEFSWLIGLHIPPDLLPAVVLWIANGIFLLVLVYAAMQSPVRMLLENQPSQHVYFGAMVGLLLLWGLKAGINPGLGFHHLGATVFVLMFGWPLALFGLTVVLGMSLLLQTGIASSSVTHELPVELPVELPMELPMDLVLAQMSVLGINGLISIVIPVWSSWTVLKLAQRHLPDNFFIYIFVVAFFGAGIAVAASRVAAICLFWLSGAYPETTLISQSLLMLPLFMFPEMFITGMLISIFVVYKPSWVLTFDDERYLVGK